MRFEQAHALYSACDYIYFLYNIYMYTQHTRTYCNRARRSPSSYKAYTSFTIRSCTHEYVYILFVHTGCGPRYFPAFTAIIYHTIYIAYPVYTTSSKQTSAAENRQNTAVVHSIIYNSITHIVILYYIYIHRYLLDSPVYLYLSGHCSAHELLYYYR